MSTSSIQAAQHDARRPRRTHVPRAIRMPANTLLELLVGGIGRLPRPLSERLGLAMASLWFRVWRHWRQRALTNLEVAYPDWPHARHMQVLRGAFDHLARSGVDIVRAGRESRDRRCATCSNHAELARTLEADRESGRGVVVVGAHIGNWQLASALYAAIAPTTTLVTEYRDSFFADMLSELRTQLDVAEASAGDWPLDLLRALQRAEIVTIMADVEQRRRPGVFVPFFGQPTWMTVFPVELARLTGAVLRPIFMLRTETGYRASIHERIPVPTRADGEQGVRVATAAWAAVLEREIRRNPEQWLWMARRWHVEPDETGVGILSRRKQRQSLRQRTQATEQESTPS